MGHVVSPSRRNPPPLPVSHPSPRVPSPSPGSQTILRLRCAVKHTGKLRALVCDILPPTTAIISYATSLQKLSANGQLTFVTKNSDDNYIRRFFYQTLPTQVHIKPNSFESRPNFFSSPGGQKMTMSEFHTNKNQNRLNRYGTFFFPISFNFSPGGQK